MKTGTADLPLHWGSCPRWLFERMKKLSRKIAEAIIIEYGTKEFLKRISDPFFFQSFSCVVGFDWHSSGTTTTLLGALKSTNLHDYGLGIAGGKGSTARKTPEEIETISEKIGSDPEKIIYASKISAKVDSSAVQDGFELYHHVILFDEKNNWAVVQQGMNTENRYARRYHWFNTKNKVVEPHEAVVSDIKTKTLNLVAKESEDTQKTIVELASERPENIKRLVMDSNHWFDLRPYEKVLHNLEKTYEEAPESFEKLLLKKGVGAKTIRALALISKIIYGTELSWKDPAKFSFAHGGKDGIPHPVDRKLYDENILILEEAIENAKIGKREKLEALKRIAKVSKD